MGRCESCDQKIPPAARCPLCGHRLAEVEQRSELIPALITGAVILGGAAGVIALLLSPYRELGVGLVGVLLLIGWVVSKVDATRSVIDDLSPF